MAAGHGNTPAAWTAVSVAMVGFVIGSVALLQVPTQMTLLWLGIIVALVAFPLFLVLAKLGLNASDH
ncbi:putative membrane protein YfcA [Nocardioides cavernae]|uniref:Putative membrane protein YfcA n=1 Tax=Nocardioides cavernae TaxID=1921566 RepID=A0A7Y9KTT4_9ACTN|nr:HGxxPAAW family protein [Nocardioides cavernae]NYE38770.1 putative membrane protein YfcA [Nocardioides cavernae]